MAEQTFKDLLNTLLDSVYQAGAKERDLPPYAQTEKQALLDYVARLEANQITPEIQTLYDDYMAYEPSNHEINKKRQLWIGKDILIALFKVIDPERWILKPPKDDAQPRDTGIKST